MQLLTRKNFLLFLAAILVVALGYMALSTGKVQIPYLSQPTYEQEMQNIEIQSETDDINSIEKDLNDTDLQNSDKELQDIDAELNKAY
ncbi:hypothetical protein A2955_03330 [Candidatus Woesebacteria bacterium RIFCSPLOWO2_01_FULL_37_19]|uniref:Uncharacterized protein n=2 Tax=Candidatus Woeseibacteriota TaxID=1752722 RepID=A0A1F8BB68_9BACT|nr:MAG: hypothetical protein A2771_02910 [Candidatus Woesebacteria bacterium RIFCSPHIGHO2_01_FULL_38_26b]OGM61297.1 MAG: hypothetical protein A2955_03330 [Candidatus Woesebacteria bacterium RIFCSPLOWO2_01_FULL_37_19]